MIPLAFAESIVHVEEDGGKWTFRPKTGALESKNFELLARLENAPALEQTQIMHEAVGAVLVSYENGTRRMDGPELVAALNGEECANVMRMWHEANKIKVEQKKS